MIEYQIAMLTLSAVVVCAATVYGVIVGKAAYKREQRRKIRLKNFVATYGYTPKL